MSVYPQMKVHIVHHHWAAYDTTWGASDGMLQFKKKLGYAPHNVKWVWDENPIVHKTGQLP